MVNFVLCTPSSRREIPNLQFASCTLPPHPQPIGTSSLLGWGSNKQRHASRACDDSSDTGFSVPMPYINIWTPGGNEFGVTCKILSARAPCMKPNYRNFRVIKVFFSENNFMKFEIEAGNQWVPRMRNVVMTSEENWNGQLRCLQLWT